MLLNLGKGAEVGTKCAIPVMLLNLGKGTEVGTKYPIPVMLLNLGKGGRGGHLACHSSQAAQPR